MSRPRVMALLLALVTLLVFLPVAHDAFVDYDDGDYVKENHGIQAGLTWSTVKWAFTTSHSSNWHPLTWLSLMVDYKLFGLNAGGYHLVNALFHAANAALLLLLLVRLGGALWPCVFVAALFAWHPLHVESVAWISERKDVLSTFFGLLTLLCYARSVEESKVRDLESKVQSPRSKVFYVLAMLMFALGLMSKPMLVTLPFVMLLLDYWPLQRFNVSTLQRLFREKIPFFLLAAISCVVTFLVQRNGDAVVPLHEESVVFRLATALVAYGRYLLKAFCPVNLAVIYPLENGFSWIQLAVAAVVLAAVSVFAWRLRRPCPYLLVGWLWFLGTLVPVIGLVQVGSAALADRYTYFPLIGIFIAVTFGACDLAKRFHFSKIIPSTAAAVILAACLILTENQLRYWRNSEALFAHAIAVTRDNEIAHENRGLALENDGRRDEAMAEYREALRLAPTRGRTRNDLANLLFESGRTNEALAEYQKAIQLDPSVPMEHVNYGVLLVALGRFDDGMKQYSEAARLDPTNAIPPYSMGQALLRQGRDAEAIPYFRNAMRLNPGDFQTLVFLSRVLASDENPRARDGNIALALALKANALTGGDQPAILDTMAMAYAETGRFDDAQQAGQDAINVATNDSRLKSDVPGMEKRLEFYKNRRPWRESFTNEAPENFPKVLIPD